MLVIHGPGTDTISDIVSPLPGEFVLDSYNWIPDDIELHLILLKHDIKTLFYVGYATNMCVLNRAYGIKQMHNLGYQVILLRDATAGIEFHDTFNGKWATLIAIREVENMKRGYTCTTEDFIRGITRQ